MKIVESLRKSLPNLLKCAYSDLKKDPKISASQQTAELAAKVGKLLEVPTDETPTIATVEDKEKLNDQDFFGSVENGDKILIYPRARKAIIYRPSTNKIINVGPLAINSQTNQADSAEQ